MLHPIRPSLPRRRNRSREGALTLIAITGRLITRTEASHTHVEWLRFLKQIDRETPKHLDLHLIADNYATHKHPKVKAWLEKHPRFTMHFTPTSSSWLNLVERFFADMNAYLAERNANPKPYKWAAKGEAILAKIRRARAALDAAVVA